MTQRHISAERHRDFIGILFDCCHVYARIYINSAGTAFEGHCPCGMKRVVIPISEDGSSDRFLQVD